MTEQTILAKTSKTGQPIEIKASIEAERRANTERFLAAD